MGCHSLLQGIFSTQGLNPGLLHCRQTLYQLSLQGRLILVHFSSKLCTTVLSPPPSEGSQSAVRMLLE